MHYRKYIQGVAEQEIDLREVCAREATWIRENLPGLKCLLRASGMPRTADHLEIRHKRRRRILQALADTRQTIQRILTQELTIGKEPKIKRSECKPIASLIARESIRSYLIDQPSIINEILRCAEGDEVIRGLQPLYSHVPKTMVAHFLCKQCHATIQQLSDTLFMHLQPNE